MSSSSSSSDQHLSTSDVSEFSEQLCCVHCNICDTVLAVSVPCTSLFKTVTVRCGHCTTLLPVNMRLFFPSLNQFHTLGHNNLYSHHQSQTFTDRQNLNTNYMFSEANGNPLFEERPCARGVAEDIPPPCQPAVNRPPEKRQRVPSAYNCFIREEIQRIKAENPEITHREAFSAAAKNWAHFPHIQFAVDVMPNQTAKRSNTLPQEGEDPMVKEGFLASANLGISPYY